MTLSDRIADVLSPHMGQATARAVALHVCAKFGANGEAELAAEERTKLGDFLRRGLVAYVGADKAAQLAAACMENKPTS